MNFTKKILVSLLTISLFTTSISVFAQNNQIETSETVSCQYQIVIKNKQTNESYTIDPEKSDVKITQNSDGSFQVLLILMS